ncbi:MAG: asparaginase [Acidimicrobiales bacterium]
MRDDNPVLVRRTRGGHVESLHRGVWVRCRADGTVIEGAGDPDQLVWARSSVKGLQAVALVETGALDAAAEASDGDPTWADRALALACSSHSGEPQHLALAAEVLAAIGLDEAALQCGPATSVGAGVDAPARPLAHNCSGKHAGFLVLAAHLGADVDGYLDPGGPAQQAVLERVERLVGGRLTLGIDGCSAPTIGLPLSGLATGIARLTAGDAVLPHAEACGRITAACVHHPRLVGGTRDRFDSDLMAASGGDVFAKVGADGVLVVAPVDAGEALAIKIDDGHERGNHLLVLELLRRWGWLDGGAMSELGAWNDPALRNAAGAIVGRVELA